MDNKYLLPALLSEVEPSAAECWEKREDAYDFLMNNLRLEYEPTESVFDGGSSAMPHMFEQMLIFEEAFFDEKSQDHDRAIMEWRAIFILLALKRIKNIKLDVVKVDLSGNSENPFLKAVAKFKPEDAPVLINTTWDFTYVLMLDTDPIALFSPVTVVCPAKTFKKRIESLDWICLEKIDGREKLLLKFDGRGNEYANIKEWITFLQTELFVNKTDSKDAIVKFEALKTELDLMVLEYSYETTQGIDSSLLHNIYSSINNNIRKEYNFLNICCDFKMDDPKMKFLVDKHQDDIFYEKLLLFVYDDKPDTITNKSNIEKLHCQVNHIMDIGGREMITVWESGGEELALFAFLPLRQEFVAELINYNISPEDFFEEYRAIYDKQSETIEIVMVIRNFPYWYRKVYKLSECTRISSNIMPSLYLWPQKSIKGIDWNSYYSYVSWECGKRQVQIQIPNTVSHNYEPVTNRESADRSFKLFRSDVFPEYIYLTSNQVSGCLPLKKQLINKSGVGATATIYIDVGHATTYVTIVKQQYGESGEQLKSEKIGFRLPESSWILGTSSKDESVRYNFIAPETTLEENPKLVDIRHYFKNILNDFTNYQKKPNKYSMTPFEDGQILFSDTCYQNKLENGLMCFIGFEYALMDKRQRERVHIFLEQTLMYIVHNSILADCSYFKVRFLHTMKENSEILGELKGLWEDVLKKVMQKTGVRTAQISHLGCCSEYEALAYSVYHEREKDGKDRVPNLDGTDICVGVDIGWKKTVVVDLRQNEHGNAVDTVYTKLNFAGKDISFLDKDIVFTSYQNVLSVLLSESYSMNLQTENRRLLNEFGKLYGGTGTDEDYFYGLFDLIAMKIEKDDFAISPDIYNRKPEFRSYIKLLTYNMLLLFLEVGMFIGKNMKVGIEKPHHIDIYLSGNGAKFLRWIANLKKIRVIGEDNSHALFIVKLEHTLLDVVRNGISITHKTAKEEEINCAIILTDNPKGQLLEGYVFKDSINLNDIGANIPQFNITRSEELNADVIKGKVMEEVNRIIDDVFREEDNLQKLEGTQLDSWSDVENIIKLNSKEICREVARQIDGR